jgi:hypothetical protein
MVMTAATFRQPVVSSVALLIQGGRGILRIFVANFITQRMEVPWELYNAKHWSQVQRGE